MFINGRDLYLIQVIKENGKGRLLKLCFNYGTIVISLEDETNAPITITELNRYDSNSN